MPAFVWQSEEGDNGDNTPRFLPSEEREARGLSYAPGIIPASAEQKTRQYTRRFPKGMPRLPLVWQKTLAMPRVNTGYSSSSGKNAP